MMNINYPALTLDVELRGWDDRLVMVVKENGDWPMRKKRKCKSDKAACDGMKRRRYAELRANEEERGHSLQSTVCNLASTEITEPGTGLGLHAARADTN